MPKTKRTRTRGTRATGKAFRRMSQLKRAGVTREEFDRHYSGMGSGQTTHDFSRMDAADRRISGLQARREQMQESHQNRVADWQKRRRHHRFDLKVAQERARAVDLLNGSPKDARRAAQMGRRARSRLEADTRPEFNTTRYQKIGQAISRQNRIIGQGPRTTMMPMAPATPGGAFAQQPRLQEASDRMGASPTVSQGPSNVATSAGGGAFEPVDRNRGGFGGGLY